jgi:hypothetical protein
MSATWATRSPVAALRAWRSRSRLWSLARAEGRRLLRHPLFAIGMLTTGAALVLASGRLADAGIPAGASDKTEIVNFLAGDCVVMLGAASWTFLASFLAASRERRDGAQDFYAGQPVTQPLRTAAALLSLTWAGLAVFVLVTVATLAFAGMDGGLTVQGTRYYLRPLELLQGPLYVVLAGALGVLLGTWTRHVVVACLAAVALFLGPIGLVPWLVLGDDESRGFYGAMVAGGPVAWHLLAFCGLTALAAAGALARSDRRPRVALLGLAGLAATAAFAIGAPAPVLASAFTRVAPASRRAAAGAPATVLAPAFTTHARAGAEGVSPYPADPYRPHPPSRRIDP